MHPRLAVAAVALSAAALGGCVSQGGPGPQLASVAGQPQLAAVGAEPQAGAKWNMPWQLNPASAASEAQGEKTYVAEVPNYGRVKGTTPALTYVNYPLTSLAVKPGRNRTVEACRDVVASQAKPLGAVKVEAVSAGPDRRTRQGYEGPVAFRVFYAKQGVTEVRQSLMTCKVDRAGHIKDAFVDPHSTSKLAQAVVGGPAAPPPVYTSLRP